MLKKSILTTAIKVSSKDDMPFEKCSICGRTFSIADLIVDIRDGKKVYKCNQCCTEGHKN